jgi:hypothetical protein
MVLRVFGNVAVEEPKEEFEVATEELVVCAGKVAVAAVRLQMAGAEHADKALELETVKRKIESNDEKRARFAENELDRENGQDGEG